MSTPLRSLLSVSIGPGLTLFTAWSVFAYGPLASSTMLGFGLTIAWGIVEIALLCYAPAPSIELDHRTPLDEPAARHDASALVDFSAPDLHREKAA